MQQPLWTTKLRYECLAETKFIQFSISAFVFDHDHTNVEDRSIYSKFHLGLRDISNRVPEINTQMQSL